MRLCIVTGLSGSGKSTAMQVFEDLMYFTVDGLPASMAPEMAALMERPSMAHFKGIALGLDLRQSTFLSEIEDVLEKLRDLGYSPQAIFLEADTQEIMRRYATTRRPHPLEHEGIGLEAAVLMERKRMARLRSQADMVLNTTRFSIHDLRRVLQKRFRDGEEHLRALRVFVLSFGFKHGVPKDADYIFDLRFLPNPYFVSELRAKSGLEQDVADYVFATPKAREFLTKLTDLLFFILPLMETEGRYRLTMGFGCTGGHHRSVAVAEAIGRALQQAGFPVTIEHRHLELG
ncbi:MAG: RNase adapter RapZ [Desulfovibrionaceae bacterium]|nr:RNase adapter RapZ [Desulfovibrionaceae bacterium]